MRFNSLTLLVLFLFYFASSFATLVNASDKKTLPKITKAPFSIGETLQFESLILNEKRRLNVYLPASYSSALNKHYPVIYLLDGSKDEDFIHIAGIVQFGSFSWINMLEESIVVGIANVDRKRDFTYPSQNSIDKKELPTSGGSAKFIQALSKEIMPLIKSSFRTKSQTTLIGQSLGGLLATEIALTMPSLFNNYIIVSPSLWWDNETLLINSTRLSKPLPTNTKIVVAVGKEGEVMERVAKQLYQNLSSQHDQVTFNSYEQLSHGDTLHLAVYDAFTVLFQSKKETP